MHSQYHGLQQCPGLDQLNATEGLGTTTIGSVMCSIWFLVLSLEAFFLGRPSLENLYFDQKSMKEHCETSAAMRANLQAHMFEHSMLQKRIGSPDRSVSKGEASFLAAVRQYFIQNDQFPNMQ